MESSLKKAVILLVSSHTSHRAGLRKVLFELGADNHHIEVASDYVQSRERLKKGPVHIVISDDDIGEAGSGLDLIALHEANNPISKDRLFILMASEANTFSESEFILKGGDLFIPKPFTNDIFIKAFRKIYEEKMNAPADEKMAFDLQDALKAKNMDTALEMLASFKDNQSHPALVSKGMIYEADRDYGRAFEAYVQALHRKVDLRSLSKVIQTGIQSNNLSEIGEFVEMWVKDFPLHEEVVPDLLRVILYNKKFELLNQIIEPFSRANIPESRVKISISAGLVVAASMYVERGELEKAIDFAVKGIEFSNFKVGILLNGLQVLMAAGGTAEAERIYQMLLKKNPFSDDQVLLVRMQEIIYPREISLKTCLDLISKNLVDPEIFQIAINGLRETGQDVEEIIKKARRIFPNHPFVGI